MSIPDENADGQAPEQKKDEAVNLQDMLGGLQFTPTWAKSSGPQKISYEERPEREDRRFGGDRHRDQNRDRRGGGGGGGKPARRPDRDGDRSGRRPDAGRGGGKPGGGRSDRPDFQSRQRPPREEIPRLPVEVSFIPERDRLGAVVRQLHAVKRAFPLTYIAGLFLKKPEHHLIKIEARPGQGEEPIQFFQCRKTRAVFLSREELIDYLVRVHLEEHFERAELTIDPPAGNFVCVGQCRRSGALLGPPNYHGYNERLQELHRARFAHQSFDEFRNSIEMIRDPEVIERWRQECTRQVRYRPKDTPEAEPNLTLAQAERMFVEKYSAGYVLSGAKVIMPASVFDRCSDRRLQATLRAARMREDRFPLSLMLALRPAFRRMRLHLFKAGREENFVTAIPPKPFDAEHAIPEIKEVMALITENPGWSRRELVDRMFPGKTMDDPEVASKLSSLVWLIDKGHIIEFFNGTFAIPGHLRKPGAVPNEAPQEHHHDVPANSTPGSASAPVDLPPPETLPEDVSEVTAPESGETTADQV